jgi:succinyl-CoA synthetase alpha subunit
MIKANGYVKERNARLIGPNCPGVTPGEAKSRYYAWFVFKKGTVGIVSKSGTLTYEAADQVVKQGLYYYCNWYWWRSNHWNYY